MYVCTKGYSKEAASKETQTLLQLASNFCVHAIINSAELKRQLMIYSRLGNMFPSYLCEVRPPDQRKRKHIIKVVSGLHCFSLLTASLGYSTVQSYHRTSKYICVLV